MKTRKQPQRKHYESIVSAATSMLEAADLADGLREPVQPGDARQGSRGAPPKESFGRPDWYDDFGGHQKR